MILYSKPIKAQHGKSFNPVKDVFNKYVSTDTTDPVVPYAGISNNTADLIRYRRKADETKHLISNKIENNGNTPKATTSLKYLHTNVQAPINAIADASMKAIEGVLPYTDNNIMTAGPSAYISSVWDAFNGKKHYDRAASNDWKDHQMLNSEYGSNVVNYAAGEAAAPLVSKGLGYLGKRLRSGRVNSIKPVEMPRIGEDGKFNLNKIDHGDERSLLSLDTDRLEKVFSKNSPQGFKVEVHPNGIYIDSPKGFGEMELVNGAPEFHVSTKGSPIEAGKIYKIFDEALPSGTRLTNNNPQTMDSFYSWMKQVNRAKKAGRRVTRTEDAIVSTQVGKKPSLIEKTGAGSLRDTKERVAYINTILKDLNVDAKYNMDYTSPRFPNFSIVKKRGGLI